jgi:Flp pilus assembly protein TadG
MILKDISDDAAGAAGLEFALTAPIFFVALLGLLQLGLWLWTQAGLQHGAAMAARCASVNTAVCTSPAAIQQFAASQAFALNVPAATFSVSQSACGNLVSASYVFPNFAPGLNLPSVTIRASSCFPM